MPARHRDERVLLRGVGRELASRRHVLLPAPAGDRAAEQHAAELLVVHAESNGTVRRGRAQHDGVARDIRGRGAHHEQGVREWVCVGDGHRENRGRVARADRHLGGGNSCRAGYCSHLVLTPRRSRVWRRLSFNYWFRGPVVRATMDAICARVIK